MFRLKLRRAPRFGFITGAPFLLLVLWLSLVFAFEYLKHSPRFSAVIHPGATVCLFRNLTGHPCPTCGSTRMLTALLQGHLLESFLYNPFMFITGMVVVVLLLLRVGFSRVIYREVSPGIRRFFLAVLLLLFLLNWFYLLCCSGL